MEQKQVLLIYGWGGTVPPHWENWLKKELEQRGIKVFFPDLPNNQNPAEKEWLEAIFRLNFKFDSSTILVGHSLGVPTILRVLERLPEKQKVQGAILVSGFCRDLGIPEIVNFVNRPFNWEKIRTQAKRFVQVYSDNDPYVPVKESLFLAEQLGIRPILEKNAGHITTPVFGPYPRLLKLALKEFA